MGEYEINHDAIRRDVYRRFRKYVWFGVHFFLMLTLITLAAMWGEDSASGSTILDSIAMIAFISWFVHIPYLVLMILRERAVQKAIERERKAYYQALQQRPAPQYQEAAMRLTSDGELVETVDDYFYDEKPKHFEQGE